MKPPSQNAFPFSTEPLDFCQPVEFRFSQLRDVAAAAERAGYRIFQLKVEHGGYQAEFVRKPAITTP